MTPTSTRKTPRELVQERYPNAQRYDDGKVFKIVLWEENVPFCNLRVLAVGNTELDAWVFALCPILES